MTEQTITNKPVTDEDKWNKPCDNWCEECMTACNDDDFVAHATHKKERSQYSDNEWKAHTQVFSTTFETDLAIREGRTIKPTLEELKQAEADALLMLESET
jgi:hypothetical protein